MLTAAVSQPDIKQQQFVSVYQTKYKEKYRKKTYARKHDKCSRNLQLFPVQGSVDS